MSKRLRVKLKVTKGEVFLCEGYHEEIYRFFMKYFENLHFSATSFLAKKKIETDEGIWLINKVDLIICSPYIEKLVKLAMNLPKDNMIIQNNVFEVQKVVFISQEILFEGRILSGIYSHGPYGYLEYEKSPEIFSEYLRQRLIYIYKDINGVEPQDKRFMISLKKGWTKYYTLNIPMYKGIYQMFGSTELCNIFIQSFVTGRI